MRAHHGEMVRSPAGRDGFALGEIFGYGAAIEHFEERYRSIIEQRAEDEKVDRPFDTTGSVRAYEF